MSDAPALFQKHQEWARFEARNWYIPGADFDDVLQHARVGLWEASRSFDGSRGSVFKSFAGLCMRREIITALKTAQRMKHGPLNDSIRHGVNDDGEDVEVVDLLGSSEGDPLRCVIAREELERITAVVWGDMTPLERQALIGLANGMSYDEIEATLGVAHKTVDNAIQRARRKLAESELEAAA